MLRTTDDPAPRSNGQPGPFLDYARAFRRSARAWARSTFSRDQLRTALKSLAWVGPLSILIWIYAEREQQKSQERQAIPFQIRTSDPREVVTVVRPSDQVILANLKGPRKALDDLVRNLLPAEGHPGATIVLPQSYASGREHEIPTSAIRDSVLFRSSGVSVSDEVPTTLRVRVDKLVDVVVPVAPPDGDENFVAPPTFEPREVRVTLPQAVLDAIPAGEPLAAYADLGKLDAGPQTLSVAVTLSLRDLAGVTVTPDRVIATVDVKNAEREFKIDSMPIFVVAPPNLQDKWRVRVDPEFVPNVVVTGPREAIDQIAAGTMQPFPKATLEVTADDVNKPPQPRRLGFDLPPGVKVVRQGESRTVTFTLIDRSLPEQ